MCYKHHGLSEFLFRDKLVGDKSVVADPDPGVFLSNPDPCVLFGSGLIFKKKSWDPY